MVPSACAVVVLVVIVIVACVVVKKRRQVDNPNRRGKILHMTPNTNDNGHEEQTL